MSKRAWQCVLAIVALLIPAGLAIAEDRPTDAQCRNFANFAVQNAQDVRRLGCSTLPWRTDPTLSLNKDYHFRWCRMMRTETVEKMMEVLVAQSSKCAYCRHFEDVVSALRIIAIRENCNMKDFSQRSDLWDAFAKPSAHEMCMASEVVSGGHHYYDVAWVKPGLDSMLAEMAYDLETCEWRRRTNEATFEFSVVPKCATCHDSKRTTATSPASLRPGPKRVSTDPAIARQPPAFTPVPERRRTPHDTGRNTSSGSDQVKRGDPASGGSSSSAMDRLGGGGTGGAPSGGGQGGGGAAPKSSGGGGGASSASPSANNPAPNINSNTIKQQAPAFGPTPGLR